MSLTYGFCLGDEDTSYTAASFSEAFRRITGDGVCEFGGKFSLTLSGFSAGISTGYALCGGCWLENDAPLALVLPASGNYADRVDAIAVQLDAAQGRTASLTVLEGYDALQETESGVYILPLYLIHVKRGAVNLYEEDATDVREYVPPLSELSAGTLKIYDFFTSGIDRETSRLIQMSEALVSRAEAASENLTASIQQTDGTAQIGELLTARDPPLPALYWLLCTGGAVPSPYPALSTMLSGVLPDLSRASDRYKTYIYAGEPV